MAGDLGALQEVKKVYIGSFWDNPLKHTEHAGIFERDKDALLREVSSTHAQICTELRKG